MVIRSPNNYTSVNDQVERLLQITIATLAVTLLLSVGSASNEVLAQGNTNHAGLVVAFPDGTSRTYCIPFAQPAISGLDLLVASGLDVKVQAYGGLGAEICEIGSAGCDYPNQACACQSYGPNGVYWSYFHLQNGAWKASLIGAGSYRVLNGDVDGWAYSSGKPPGLYSFAQLCPSVAPPSHPVPTVAAPVARPTARPPANTPTRRQPVPSATPKRAAPTPQPARPQPTAEPLSPTPAESVSATSTATPTPSPAAPPASAATSTLTTEPSPTSTIMTLPTGTAAIPTPAVGNVQPASPNPEDTARNLGLIVGAITLGSLAVWGISRLARKGRNGEGSDVE